VIDARRGEVYSAVFSRRGSHRAFVTGQSGEVPELLASISPAVCFVGGGAAYEPLISRQAGEFWLMICSWDAPSAELPSAEPKEGISSQQQSFKPIICAGRTLN
jgi:tRNA A37 threonylcarbamoyladenosine modification protein TsaB